MGIRIGAREAMSPGVENSAMSNSKLRTTIREESLEAFLFCAAEKDIGLMQSLLTTDLVV